jgi:hypothetical protein
MKQNDNLCLTVYYKIHRSHLQYVFNLTFLTTIWEDRKLIFSLHNFFVNESGYAILILYKKQSSPVTGLEWPRGFQEVKVPRFLDNGTAWW